MLNTYMGSIDLFHHAMIRAIGERDTRKDGTPNVSDNSLVAVVLLSVLTGFSAGLKKFRKISATIVHNEISPLPDLRVQQLRPMVKILRMPVHFVTRLVSIGVYVLY